MSGHIEEADLHLHYDDDLPAADRWRVEEHLSTCRDCAQEYERIRQIAQRVAALPPSLEPEVDLWSGIAERIGAGDELGRRRAAAQRRMRTVGWIAAVAAALLVGVGLGRLLPGEVETVAPVAQLPAASAALLASYEQPEYDEAVAELEMLLETMRDELEPETVAVVEENLAIIDTAIAEARAALMEDPVNEQLHMHLADTMQRKLRLLRTVATAVANT